MELIKAELPLEPLDSECVVAVGSFDGVHIGHQALLSRTVNLARGRGIIATAFTFEPPPGLFFNKKGKLRLLTVLEQKVSLIAKTGIDRLILMPFDHKLAQMKAEEFAQNVLHQGLNAQVVLCGPNHAFGAGRTGGAISLVSAGCGLSVEVIPAVRAGEKIVSSSLLREQIAGGDLSAAREGLGRHYSILGKQVPGSGRGRKLGFPTINLQWDESQLLPPQGVYACKVSTLQAQRWAAVNIGTNPTFGDLPLSLEAHLIDSTPESSTPTAYEVYFVKRLRDEIRFESETALKAQIERDVEAVRTLARDSRET